MSLTPAQLRVAQVYLQAQANVSAIMSNSSSSNMDNLSPEPEDEEEVEEQRRSGVRMSSEGSETSDNSDMSGEL